MSVSHERSQEEQNNSSSIINKPYPKEHRKEMKIQKRQKRKNFRSLNQPFHSWDF